MTGADRTKLIFGAIDAILDIKPGLNIKEAMKAARRAIAPLIDEIDLNNGSIDAISTVAKSEIAFLEDKIARLQNELEDKSLELSELECKLENFDTLEDYDILEKFGHSDSANIDSKTKVIVLVDGSVPMLLPETISTFLTDLQKTF